MRPDYTYTSSIDYANKLKFDYAEAYSFQRGDAFEQNRKLMQAEFSKLTARKDKKNDLTDAQNERFNELNCLVGYTQYLINENGALHPSAVKTNIFQHTDAKMEDLIAILKTEIKDIPRWLCAPVYRDGLIFYDNNSKIVSVLNVCLSCEYIETAKFNHINADYKTYESLRRFFIDIGHEVEVKQLAGEFKP